MRKNGIKQSLAAKDYLPDSYKWTVVITHLLFVVFLTVSRGSPPPPPVGRGYNPIWYSGLLIGSFMGVKQNQLLTYIEPIPPSVTNFELNPKQKKCSTTHLICRNLRWIPHIFSAPSYKWETTSRKINKKNKKLMSYFLKTGTPSNWRNIP